MVNAMVYAGLPDSQMRLIKLHVKKGKYSDIIDAVCEEYGIKKRFLFSPSRLHHLSEARQISFYLLRKVCGMTLSAIGVMFNRNHTTVMYGISTCEDLLKYDKNFRKRMESVKNRLS